MTRVKPDNFIGRVGSQPDIESIGLDYVEILPNLNSVKSGGNMC